MTFACPGGCGKRHPLDAGQLVICHTDRPKHLAEPVAAILCAPCTADLVLHRARATSGARVR